MEDRIEWLQGNDLVRMAARIGERFKIDPITVLRDGGDSLLNEIRVAAMAVIAADEKAAQAAAKK